MKINNEKTPIYLQTWFIAILFAFWMFILPAIAGVYLLIKKYQFDKAVRDETNKVFEDMSAGYEEFNNWYESSETKVLIETIKNWEKQKEEREKYNQQLDETKSEIQREIKCLKIEAKRLQTDISDIDKREAGIKKLHDTKSELEQEIKQLEQEAKRLQADITVESVMFSTVDENISSEEYKSKYNLLVLEEKEIIKQEKSIKIIDKTISKKIISNDIKQLQRCFNSETDTLMRSITSKNIETIKGRIIKTFETLNKLFITDGISLSKEILEIKLKETDLIYGYEYQKEQERLQQKAIREQMIEEEKVRREIEKEKEKIEKEEKHFHNEINKLMDRLRLAADIEKQLYIDKINELNSKLNEVEESKKNVLERESNTRAGYVYIISNIGSFGENVYKIGMTRRLDPLERISELGSASVPFEFDVHAMIFSDDAPTLETTLHNTFKDKRVNMVNTRKEFFRVSLDEIIDVVKQNFNATVEFTMTAKAEQFRETQRILSKLA